MIGQEFSKRHTWWNVCSTKIVIIIFQMCVPNKYTTKYSENYLLFGTVMRSS